MLAISDKYQNNIVCDIKIPFSSERKWSAIKMPVSDWFVLGAAEFILPKHDLSVISNTIQSYTSKGKRVLVLAKCNDIYDNYNS